MVTAKHSIPLHLYILILKFKYGTNIYKLGDNKLVVAEIGAAEQVPEALTY